MFSHGRLYCIEIWLKVVVSQDKTVFDFTGSRVSLFYRVSCVLPFDWLMDGLTIIQVPAFKTKCSE